MGTVSGNQLARHSTAQALAFPSVARKDRSSAGISWHRWSWRHRLGFTGNDGVLPMGFRWWFSLKPMTTVSLHLAVGQNDCFSFACPAFWHNQSYIINSLYSDITWYRQSRSLLSPKILLGGNVEWTKRTHKAKRKPRCPVIYLYIMVWSKPDNLCTPSLLNWGTNLTKTSIVLILYRSLFWGTLIMKKLVGYWSGLTSNHQ